MKKLYRSKKNRWLTGLCGGIAEYFDINPIAVRIAMALMELSPFGIIAYFVLAFYTPEMTEAVAVEEIAEETKEETVEETSETQE